MSYETASFLPRDSGPLRLRFAFWRIYGARSLAGRPIVWNDDGTPVIPPEVIWSERIEFDHVIEVEAERRQ